MEIFSVKDLSFIYPQCKTPAVREVSFSVERGEFVTVCGATGSGKSTLLRLFKRELAPLGEKKGDIMYCGKRLEVLDDKTSACRIGYVTQLPEQQIVTDKVWHELAFGLENMNIQSEIIRRRVAETACFFGIEDWFEKNVTELSGGQKQLLNLASVMVMQPDVLLLDEPTAQLDPIAASEFISSVVKLNRELSVTVIMIEHRLEEVIPVSDKLLVMQNGALAGYGEPRSVASAISDPELALGMPAAVRLFLRLGGEGVCPLTVREGRNFIESSFLNSVRKLPSSEYKHSGKTALKFKDVFFRYSRELPDVLKGLSFEVFENEIFCILGGNGSGKSTALSAASALIKPYYGQISIFGKKLGDYKNRSLYKNCLALLPQDVQTVFICNTVEEELADAKTDGDGLPFDLTSLMKRHPYDLSGGEQQLVALAKVLASKPRLLLLDEPTKGLDANMKRLLTGILRQLSQNGVTVVIVTHDVEFAAETADRCALFFRGEITSCSVTRDFFADNSFYTTAVNRMTRGFFDYVSTVSDAEAICKKNGRRTDYDCY
ncbi:MAG: ATP-binding cassette domain-containing protein [Firmicutes bacterium]|nr:ATP-binding cassette domain-containing protein [Bacillota bacterium]